MPEGVVNVGNEWYFEEFAKGGVRSLGLDDSNSLKPENGAGGTASPVHAMPAADEKKRILDLFKN